MKKGRKEKRGEGSSFENIDHLFTSFLKFQHPQQLKVVESVKDATEQKRDKLLLYFAMLKLKIILRIMHLLLLFLCFN